MLLGTALVGLKLKAVSPCCSGGEDTNAVSSRCGGGEGTNSEDITGTLRPGGDSAASRIVLMMNCILVDILSPGNTSPFGVSLLGVGMGTPGPKAKSSTGVLAR